MRGAHGRASGRRFSFSSQERSNLFSVTEGERHICDRGSYLWSVSGCSCISTLRAIAVSSSVMSEAPLPLSPPSTCENSEARAKFQEVASLHRLRPPAVALRSSKTLLFFPPMALKRAAYTKVNIFIRPSSWTCHGALLHGVKKTRRPCILVQKEEEEEQIARILPSCAAVGSSCQFGLCYFRVGLHSSRLYHKLNSLCDYMQDTIMIRSVCWLKLRWGLWMAFFSQEYCKFLGEN